MITKILVICLVVVAAVLWYSNGLFSAPDTKAVASFYPIEPTSGATSSPHAWLQQPLLQPRQLEQAGFKVLSWDEGGQGLNAQLAPSSAPAGAELYVQYLSKGRAACQQELDLGDVRIEAVDADIHIYRQQNPHSKVSPSLSVQRGSACWLIDGASGLDAEQDVALKLKLARLLPLPAEQGHRN